VLEQQMKNILARGGIEFLAVLLGITLSLFIDQKIEDSSIAKNEKSLLSDLQVSLNQDIDYANGILDHLKASIDSQKKVMTISCDDAENMTKEELANYLSEVMRGGFSLFPRYGVYRSLVSNSEMKYIENTELKDKLIDLYDFQFKRYENMDIVMENLYQYELTYFFVDHFGYFEENKLEDPDQTFLIMNKDPFCQGSLRRQIMKISGMTGSTHNQLINIVKSMNEISILIDLEIN
jgi:hypothetical protein